MVATRALFVACHPVPLQSSRVFVLLWPVNPYLLIAPSHHYGQTIPDAEVVVDLFLAYTKISTSRMNRE